MIDNDLLVHWSSLWTQRCQCLLRRLRKCGCVCIWRRHERSLHHDGLVLGKQAQRKDAQAFVGRGADFVVVAELTSFGAIPLVSLQPVSYLALLGAVLALVALAASFQRICIVAALYVYSRMRRMVPWLLPPCTPSRLAGPVLQNSRLTQVEQLTMAAVSMLPEVRYADTT